MQAGLQKQANLVALATRLRQQEVEVRAAYQDAAFKMGAHRSLLGSHLFAIAGVL
jgi:hypothetical protein